MTLKKFLLIFVLQGLFLALLKSWFFTHQIFANPGLQQLAFWAATIIIAAALVRRFGPISFLEAFLLAVVWTLGDLLLDLIFVSPYAGVSIFSSYQYWMGLLVMIIAVAVFHKKRHIHIRQQQHAHH
jgi:hypothetical protein